MKQDSQIEVSEGTLARLLRSIGEVDGRTQTTLAVNIALLGVLAARAPAPEAMFSAAGGFFFLATAILFVSVSMIFFAIFPRLGGPPDSLIFFRRIAELTEDEYIQKSRSLTHNSYLSDLERQSYRNAQIASKKYFWVQMSMTFLFIAVPIWVTAVYLLYGGGA